MLTAAQFTVCDLSDPIVSGTAPSSPVTNTLWLDTSVTPNLLKRWTGTAWDIVNETQIGGTNLLANSSMKSDVNKWTVNSILKADVSSGLTMFAEKPCFHFSCEEGKTKTLSQSILEKIKDDPVGLQYVVSAEVNVVGLEKGTTNFFCQMYFSGQRDNNGISVWAGSTRVSGSPGFISYNNQGWVRMNAVVQFPFVPTAMAF